MLVWQPRSGSPKSSPSPRGRRTEMRNWKRLVYYLMINVLVSACATLTVLSIWDRTRPPTSDTPTQVSQNQPGQTPAADLTATTLPGSPGNGSQSTPESQEAASNEPQEGEATPMVIEYQVQAGDTLGVLADRYDVSVEALIDANDLDDPNRLEVGQTLLIPVARELIPTPTQPLAEETEPATSQTQKPPETAGAAQVIIDSVVGAGDLASERVQLKRTGSGDLSLAGWQLLEEGGNVFTFPQLNLFEGGAVNVYTKTGQSTVVDLYWDLNVSVWQSGETVLLLDDQANVRATFRVP